MINTWNLLERSDKKDWVIVLHDRDKTVETGGAIGPEAILIGPFSTLQDAEAFLTNVTISVLINNIESNMEISASVDETLKKFERSSGND